MVRHSLVIASAALLLALPVAAGEPRERALELSTEAASAARGGAHERALELYQQAYDLDPDPILLFNMAVVHEHRGDLAAARELLDRFVAEESDPAKRREGEARREAVRARLAERSTEEPREDAGGAASDRTPPRLWDLGFHAHGGLGGWVETGFGVFFLKELHPIVDLGGHFGGTFKLVNDGGTVEQALFYFDALLRVKGTFVGGNLEVFGEIPFGYFADSKGSRSPGGLHLGVYGGLAYAFSGCCGLFLRVGFDGSFFFDGSDSPMQARLHLGFFFRL